MAFTSDGIKYLQPPTDPDHVVGRNTESPHGWCNLPIFAGSWPPDRPGPWCVTKQGMSDAVKGIGMPEGEHDSVGVVFREVRWADWQSAAPDFVTLDEALRWHADKAQRIQFNPSAALQKVIYADGYHINSSEFDMAHGGVAYRCQRAEDLGTGMVRCYSCIVPNWDTVAYIEWKPAA